MKSLNFSKQTAEILSFPNTGVASQTKAIDLDEDIFSLEIPDNVQSQHYDDDEEIIAQNPLEITDIRDEFSLKNTVNLSLSLNRKHVKLDPHREQTLPMLVSIYNSSIKPSYKAPIDLICVIDQSASMRGEKIELVKNTFKYLLRYMDELDRLSIVMFNHDAFRLIPLVRTTEKNKKKILSALRRVKSINGTDINLGMMHALQVLKQRRYVNPITSIFLLSDGKDEGAQYRVKASLQRFAVSDDITIHTFGFGTDHDPKLMSDIADLRDGNFYFIDKLDTIDVIFVDCLGGLLSSMTQSVRILIKPEQSEILQGVEIVKAYGGKSMWSLENQTYLTRFSSLISGRRKNFVLDLKIPKSKINTEKEECVEVASAEAEIIGLDGQVEKKSAELYITLLNEKDELLEKEEDDKEVMENVYRIKGASLMNEARKLADGGRNEEAKKILEEFKEELENCFIKDEEFIRNLIKDIGNSIHYIKPGVYKNEGRHSLFTSSRAHIYEKSSNDYRNSLQREMIEEVKTIKNHSMP